MVGPMLFIAAQLVARPHGTFTRDPHGALLCGVHGGPHRAPEGLGELLRVAERDQDPTVMVVIPD